MGNQTLSHMRVVSLVEFLFCKIQPWIINQIDRWIVYFADNIVYLIKLTEQKDANLILTRKCFTIAILLPLKIKLNSSQLNSYKTKNKLLYSRTDGPAR